MVCAESGFIGVHALMERGLQMIDAEFCNRSHSRRPAKSPSIRHTRAGLTALAVLVFMFSSAYGHNGNVTVAYEMPAITVDGDFSDWPSSATRVPITVPHGSPPKGEEDFQGYFRIGYNEQANSIYLGVEVRDDSVIVATKPSYFWWEQDGVRLLLDPHHADVYSDLSPHRSLVQDCKGGWTCRYDLARACRLALEVDTHGFTVLPVVGSKTGYESLNVARTEEFPGFSIKRDFTTQFTSAYSLP